MSRILPVVSAARGARGVFAARLPPPAPPVARGAMSLEGNPTFDPLSLSSAQQTRLSTIKSLITRGTDDTRDPYRIARRDCIWWYSHDLLSNIQAQLLVFRATGDLWFLDTIYELSGIMTNQLDTKYRDTCTGETCATEGQDDGFLKWVHRENPSPPQQGTDIRRDYDYATHYCSILIAYALHLNRGLTGPKSYNYGARADWLLDYHINHYEAKFRARNSKPTGFPLETQQAAHTGRIVGLAMWHYYMGLLRSDSAYTNEAARLSGLLHNEICAATPPTGGAYVWRVFVNSINNSTSWDFLSESTYTEFVIAGLMDAHFESFDGWGDNVHLQRFGRMVTEYMADNADPLVNGFADCCGGNQERCGYRTNPSSHIRPTHWRWQNGMWGTLAWWDSTGKIAGWNEAARVYSETQAESNTTWDRTRILAAQFLDTYLGGG